MDDYTSKVLKAVDFICSKVSIKPKVGIILGTGLGALAKRLENSYCLAYKDIPGFLRSTSPSHAGCLNIGFLSGVPVFIFQGRFHYYEGYSAKEVAFPVRVLKECGAQVLITSNASGGLNLSFCAGDLMLIKDHINLIPDNPLRGENNPNWGERFPDMSRAYKRELRELAHSKAKLLGINLKEGVFVAVAGPSLETPAETRFLRLIGADAVAMSLVPEVIAAVHSGLDVLGISVIANVNDPDNFNPILIEDVIEKASRAEEKLALLIRAILEDL